MSETFTFELPETPQRPMATVIVPHLHRIPPRPPWLYAEWRETKVLRKAHCHWCSEGIYPGQRKSPTRSTWHLECLNEYNILFNWQHARGIVRRRDEKICQSCGVTPYEEAVRSGRGFEVDHIVPLHQWPARVLTDLTPESFLDWYAPWLLTNLQLLCVDCHRAKTGGEASRRADA